MARKPRRGQEHKKKVRWWPRLFLDQNAPSSKKFCFRLTLPKAADVLGTMRGDWNGNWNRFMIHYLKLYKEPRTATKSITYDDSICEQLPFSKWLPSFWRSTSYPKDDGPVPFLQYQWEKHGHLCGFSQYHYFSNASALYLQFDIKNAIDCIVKSLDLPYTKFRGHVWHYCKLNKFYDALARELGAEPILYATCRMMVGQIIFHP